ncbi:hypothetical protein VNO78_30454 [Psophocarpus tetragonolobus]|uniref:Transcription factor n=1 Tax=Psophocarpus tetragonolobus TaxID=3891 RepID=A0AAN9RXD6_PSOTE
MDENRKDTKPQVNSGISENLKNLIDGSDKNWTYVISWVLECSPPTEGFKFESGYYRGRKQVKELRIMGATVSVTEEVENHAESEFFFQMSMGMFFVFFDKDLPEEAFRNLGPLWVNATNMSTSSSRFGERHLWGTWERTRWGHCFGIQTFLCIPLQNERVLEFASTEVILYDPQWIQYMADFIFPIGTPRCLNFRKKERLPVRADSGTQNHESGNLSKQSRGKEKISNSNCSWSLLTESSLLSESSDETFYSGPS